MSALTPEIKAFLRAHNIPEGEYASSKLDWACLQEICAHHIASSPALQTAARYISDRLQTLPTIHSLKVRVKEPSHLVAKIIRKKVEKPELDFQVSTYEQLITDLIGLRALHLFKQDWLEIHQFITDTWEPQEKPTANVRTGDPEELLADFASAGFDVRYQSYGYRSLHYIVKSQPDKKIRLAEIQVRTIFEEGWSEIDHRVRYPRHSSDPFLAEFLKIFNRVAGSADEMGTFIKELSIHFHERDAELVEIQAQMTGKEKEVEETVSRLKISEKEKNELKKQIQNANASSFAAITVNLGTSVRVGDLLKNVRINSPILIDASILGYTCTQCGKRYHNTTLSALGNNLCADCTKLP